jgi:hypothetical protein
MKIIKKTCKAIEKRKNPGKNPEERGKKLIFLPINPQDPH